MACLGWDVAREAERQPTVSLHVLRALLDLVDGAGPSRRGSLRDELQQALADTRGSLPRSVVDTLLLRALDRTGDCALGLHCAAHFTCSSFAPLSYLVAHAANLRQAFALVHRFSALFADAPFFEVHEHHESVVLRIAEFSHRVPALQCFKTELVLNGFRAIIDQHGGKSTLVRLNLAYPRPAHADAYSRVFAYQTSFARGVSELVLPRAVFEACSQYRDDDLRSLLTPLVDERLRRVAGRTGLAERTRSFLFANAGDPLKMADAARGLGTSVRSLSRRLREEGTSYLEIEHEVLSSMAARILKETDLSTKAVADQMGFADANAFRRAFKRWTGQSPNAFRREARRNAR